MTPLLFPDNTVLVNFALINRMDLLGKVTNGNGMWCATVADECRKSSRVSGLETMTQARDIFGDPLYPTRVELSDTLVLRVRITQPDDSPEKSLGEAETIAIMSRRHPTGILVTDDGGARLLAKDNDIKVLSTWHLLRMAVRARLVDGDTAWGYVQTLGSLNRGRPRGVSDRATFDLWIGQLPGLLPPSQ